MSGQEIRRIYRTARDEDLPSSLKITMGDKVFEYSKVQWKVEGRMRGLRYGTNPHQKAALYRPKQSKGGIGNVDWVKWGKDGPSATNIEDGSHGLRIVSYFKEPTVTVMKHLNPSGVSVSRGQDSLSQVYVRARDADNRAAFGSVVVSNTPVDRRTAEEIMKTFVEVVYAPGYSSETLAVFESKRDIRVGEVPAQRKEGMTMPPDVVVLDDGSLIIEDHYRTGVLSMDDVKRLPVPTKKTPSDQEYLDLLHAWWVACEVRSNAVVFWRNGTSLAIGTGQQDRIGAIENSTDKAHKLGYSLEGSVLASDGFLPKLDNIEALAKEKVLGIIQPGGSVEDQAIVRACDEHGIKMVLTGERSFRHF
ncbi:MAG TPA: IMP cyclohydrolase [Candidatus Bathyarchaeia archaeon]|nr:IMP cyclohydrolase [Candidatus Bathyarchaeia archaeon]